jgi:hypothetical protein
MIKFIQFLKLEVNMVNTFLVDSDYSKSAQQLDYRRLGKQRVEAYQILNLIQNIRLLSTQSGIQLTSENGKNFQKFVQDVKKWYTKLGHLYIITSDEKLVECYQDKKEAKVGKDERLIKMGFCNHPAVEMWYGYEDALKEYINAHIEEWIARGYKNTMKTYNVKAKEHPEWTEWSEIHENHKGALLKKELDRAEKPWYQNMQNFLSAKPFDDYIWVKIK